MTRPTSSTVFDGRLNLAVLVLIALIGGGNPVGVKPLPIVVYSALTGEAITPAFFAGGAVMMVGVYIGAFRSPIGRREAEEAISAVEA